MNLITPAPNNPESGAEKTMPSMIVTQKLIPALKKAMLTATAIASLMSCSQDEEVLPSIEEQPVAETVTQTATEETLISSLTITGLFTKFSNSPDCHCDFTITSEQHIVDGKELGVLPGQTICLEAAVNYGNLEFINLEGTEEKPILIVNRGASEELLTASSEGTADPY